MLAASRAYTQADLLIREYPEAVSVLRQTLLALDFYYGHYDMRCSMVDICYALSIPNRALARRENIEVYNVCTNFAESKIKTTDVLTAVDLLRISDALKYVQKELLSESGASYPEKLIASVWTILHDLYGPE